MDTILGALGKTTTALLALGAGVKAAESTTPFDFNNALQHHTNHALQPSNRMLLEAPRQRHATGQRVRNHCDEVPSAQPNPLGVVVAHHSEDLRWLDGHRNNATIYCKGAYEESAAQGYREWIDLPNIGLETHTYLYHIISHWHCLDDATLFTQGRADDSVDNYQGVDELFQRTLANPEGMILYRAPGTFNEWWGVWHFGKWKDELDSGVMRKSDLNPGEFWSWMFGGEPPPERVEWTWSATFAVRRDTIQRRPFRFYKRLFDHFETLNHTKPEEGHFMERFWMSVFKSEAGFPLRIQRRSRRDMPPETDRADAFP